MNKQDVIAIFDFGKTNKKVFLFDENYKIVLERSAQLPETVDEDGEPCENVQIIRKWLFDSLYELTRLHDFNIRAINFTTYGASFVYLNKHLQEILPLYSYLKEYPTPLKDYFYAKYGGEKEFSYRTSSPVLGSLNSGMQLYRIKIEQPLIFGEIKYTLHLPQYLSFLLSGQFCSDMTSIGCHTNLWDFIKYDYHDWVIKEKVIEKLCPIIPCNHVFETTFSGNNYLVGPGLHDSSAALIPYLLCFQEPFILLSTGTWCISLNPFNDSILTKEELEMDCLHYISFEGKPVKASRLFAGHEHDVQLKRICRYFKQDISRYHTMNFNPEIIYRLQKNNLISRNNDLGENLLKVSPFSNKELSDFSTDEEAYHQLILDIVMQQYKSTQLIVKGTNPKQIFVDGGFSGNDIYMNLMASVFPGMKIYAASVAQATAIGAALSIHHSWNKKPLPDHIFDLKYYPGHRDLEKF